jgi:hypothetical protein
MTYKEALLGVTGTIFALAIGVAVMALILFLVTYNIWTAVVTLLILLFVVYPVLIVKDIL